ncbi:MAG: hypothetical protein LBG60_04875 [Bifidobacteriaceae bacterium]|jgi:hypothetical protein|nr:hypothetical protein [Bifidobacteriaceae bacterium]
MRVSNQLPGPLPVLGFDAALDWDVDQRLRDLVVAPITRPLAPGAPAAISTDAGEVLDADQIADLAGRALGLTRGARLVDVEPNEIMLELGAATLANYRPLDTGASSQFDAAPAVQAAGRLRWGLPSGLPDSRVIYTMADVFDGAASILGATSAADLREGVDKLSAALAFTVASSVNTLVVTVDTWEAFDRVRDKIRAEIAAMPWLDAEVADKLEALASLKLAPRSTIEAVALRNNLFDDLTPLGFARIATEALTGAGGTHVIPTRLGQMITPTVVTILCLDTTVHADPATVAEDWRLLANMLNKPTVLSFKDIGGLVAQARDQQRILAVQSLHLRGDRVAKAAKIKFAKQAPSKANMVAAAISLIGHAKSVAVSRNLTKTRRTSFTRASRRDPLNHNVPGQTQRVDYLPDLHIYIDTSGSMSEGDYRAAVQAVIAIAKRLDVDLYVSSFSRQLSQEACVPTSKMRPAQMWRAISKLPKVTGGTDFAQVWTHINASKTRRKRINIMVTDFEWTPAVGDGPHPKSLYYLPATNMPWHRICANAKKFATACLAVEPTIGSRFIAMR